MRPWLLDAIVVALFAGHAAAAEPATAVLEISGMNCSLCPVTVRKAISREPGVLEAKVDLEHKRAEVRYDPAKTTPEKLAAAVSAAGFPAKAQAR